MKDIATIILAAGKGERIGCPKWKLKYKGCTFLDILLDKVKSIDVDQHIVCVVNSNSVPSFSRTRESRECLEEILINPFPEKGMLSSIYSGMLAFTEVAGYLIMPVDHPFVGVSTLQELVDAFLCDKGKVVRPVYKGKFGHPIVVPRMAMNLSDEAYWNKILTDGGVTLRDILRAKKIEFHDVEVSDSDILKNINRRGDLNECRAI